MELPALLERCRQGDDLAWEAFVRQFQGRIYSICSGYAPNPDMARDMAQEVFVRLFETRGRWAPVETFVPWLIKVARNLCLDLLRRRKARPPAEDVLADEMPDLAGSGPSAEADLMAGDRRRLVWKALRSLGPISREIILLKDIQGLALEEIATMLRIPIGTAKSRSNRARLELASRLLALDPDAGSGPAA